MQSIKEYIIRGVSGVFLISIIGTGLGLLNSIVFARTMGPTAYGQYSFIIEIMMFISIPVTLGLPTLLTREVAKYNNRKQFGLLKGILSWSARFVIIAGVLITVITFLVVILFKSGSNDLYLFLWALPIILLGGMSQVRMGSLRGLKKVVQNQIPDVIIRPVLVISIITYLWFIKSHVDVVIGIKVNVLANFIAFIIGVALLLRSLPYDLRTTDKELKQKEWLKEALPFLLLGGIGLINTKLSMIILGFFKPSSQVGYYKIAVIASSFISFLLNAVNMTIGPLISELYFSNRKNQLQGILTRTVRIIFVVGLSFGLIYYFWGKFFIKVLYGKDYLPSYIPLIILSFGQLTNIAAGSVANVLSMTGNQRDVVKGQIIAAVINIVLNLVLVPVYGIIGAAIATSVSLVVWNILLVTRLIRKTGINSSVLII